MRSPSDHRKASLARAAAGLVLGAAPAITLVACGGDGSVSRGGPPPTAIEYVALEPAPIERTTEYIGTLKSRRSTTVQPMVEGFVTRIAVRSGERVRAGDLVLEIDSGRQRASVASLESVRAAREADLAYARREAERQKALHAAGAASARDAEQAQTDLDTAQAQLRAVEEQIREESVQLAYYRVTAPTAGVIGDVPVRVGDRVTDSTVLTTIDAAGGLELYVRVPVADAAGLSRGLPVRVLDEAGAILIVTKVDFVSPQVDEGTQTVLVKTPLAGATGFRNEQQVRAQIVWSEEPGLRVPIVAISRVSGQSFAFVAEEADGGTVARERAVRLGPIVGNDYVVLDGLSAGDRLIVSGIQKIRDGARVDAKPRGTPERG